MLVVLNKKILIGTVGYHLLQNHSVGPILFEDLKKMKFSKKVEVEEMNWGPIAIVQYFQSLAVPFDRLIFLVAIERPDRKVGTIDVFKWKGGLPSETQIQACVGDAATGVISVENLLIIGEFFKIWPKELYLVDVEPGPEIAGEHLTLEVEERVSDILDIINKITLNGNYLDQEMSILKGDSLFKSHNLC